ncbi:MAG: tetratricopeptide repeat protein [Planctomycetes bacterium]|nr:tetratricopeptide repeat protein [Planctomycetota bacterium]
MSKQEVEALCEQGRAALDDRDHATANDAFEGALEKDPDCADAYEGLATLSYLDGDFQGAIKFYSKLTLLKPLHGLYYTNLGAIYNHIGEHQKAIDVLRKAIQRDKKCAESFYNLGIAQRKLKQNAMAVSAYKEAIKLNPDMAEAYQNLGNTYVEMGNLTMAIANFRKALEINPEFEKAKQGLDAAEQQMQTAKNAVNPFGRLVDVKSQPLKAGPTASRELNEAERWDDRGKIKQMAEEVERLAKGCVDCLKQFIEPTLLDVERTTAQSVDAAFTLPEVSENFRSAVAKWMALRKSLKRKVMELRGHEEIMNTPEFKL